MTRKEFNRAYGRLMTAYRMELKSLADECEKAGYPANGSNYDLRCTQIWERTYGPLLEELECELED